MTMFEFTPPGGEPLDAQSAGDRHGNAMFVVAAFAIGALGLAVFTASKPAAIAVAGMGVISLLFFLLSDLPDAGAVGTLDDARNSFFDAEAVPQGGFWLMMVGSLALTVTGIALATLTPEQLAALRPGARSEGDEARDGDGRTKPKRKAETAAQAGRGNASDPSASGKRQRERGRSRERR
jgi:hypothetical protein